METYCKNNHALSEENTYTRPDGYTECRICRRQIKNIWAKKNRGKTRSHSQRFFLSNRETVLEGNRQWAKVNHRKVDPIKVRAKRQRRKALKLGQMGRWPLPEHEFITLLWEIYPFCYYCDADLVETGMHEEHKIPLSRPEMKPEHWAFSLLVRMTN